MSIFIKKQMFILLTTMLMSTGLSATPKTGKINNIVIFVSFPDSPKPDSLFRSYYEQAYNDSSNSFKDYINEASYGKLEINNLFYPMIANPNNSSTVLCYRDTHSLNYYKPKTKYNTIGYEGGLEGSECLKRHDDLLVCAIEFIQKTTPINDSIMIDADEDGYIDNIAFILNADGNRPAGLWPHAGIMNNPPRINGKIAHTYNYIIMTDNYNYTRSTSISHEFCHSLGAIDLYDASLTPFYSLGHWDIMSVGTVHPTAHTKHKYLGWIDTIPEITEVGVYTLNPLLLVTNNCFQIKSPISEHEYFVLEYRKAIQGTYEDSLPGSGLTIMHINDLFMGNIDSVENEMSIYRPSPKTERDWMFAAFTDKEGRTNFNSTTSNPLCLLANGDKGGISISNVKENEDGTLSFTFDGFDVEPYFKSKDTIMLSNVKNFIHYIAAEETNLLSWTTAPSGGWISTTNDYSNKKIGFKVLSVNSTDEPRSTTVNLTVNGRLIKTFTLIQNPSPTATSLSHEMKEFSIYPNPVSNGVLKVESGELINKIEIFNLFGQKMFSQMINQNNITIPVNHLPKGVYVVRCRFANGSMNNAKVIIN